MRPVDYEIEMPSSDGWDLTDSTASESWWAQDPCDLLIALEEEDDVTED